MNKSVRLNILGNNADAKIKFDEIQARADILRAEHPEMVFSINTAEAQAKLGIIRAELKATGDTAVAAGTKASGAFAEKAWAAAKVGILGVGGAMGYGIFQAAKFQSAMERIHTQAGVSQAQLAGLGQGILKLSGQVGIGPTSLTESLYHVESAFSSLGIKGPQALSLVKIAAEGARVGNADLVDVTNALGAAVASGIPGVQNYSQAMGSLNAIVGAGDMNMQNLAEAFGTGMVAVVKGFGLSLTDVGAALATFGDNNIRGADAATALRMSVMALSVPAAAGQKQLEKWGVTAGSLGADMRHGGLLPALEHLQKLFKDNGVTAKEQGQVITEMFGKKAGTGLNVLMDQMGRLQSKYPALTQGAHGFGAAWEANTKTATQQFADLKAGSDALVTNLGQHLLPTALKVTHWLTGFVNGLEKGSVGATGLASVIGIALAGIALNKLQNGLKGAVEGFHGLFTMGKSAVSFLGQMAVRLGILKTAQVEATVATEAQTVAQTELDTAMDANPIGIVIVAVAALVAGMIYAYHHFKWFHDLVVVVFTWIKGHWPLLLGILLGPIGIAVVFIIRHWNTIWDGIKVVFNWIKGHWPLLLGILLGPIGLAAVYIVTHWNQITSGAQRMWTSVVGLFQRLPGSILRALGNMGSLLWNAGVSIISGLLGGIVQKFNDVKNFIGGIASWISNNKGPISYDATLLVPHGKAIMGGLVTGLDGGMPALSSQLAKTTAAIAGTGGASVRGASGGSGTTLTVTAQGDDLTKAVVKALRYEVRTYGGGNVQTHLGWGTR